MNLNVKRLRCCAAHHFDMQENGCELDKKWTTWALYRLGGIILLHKACPAVFCVYCIYTHGSRILLPHRCFTRVRPTPSVTPSANISSTACRKWNEEVRIIVQKLYGTTLIYIIKHVSENKKKTRFMNVLWHKSSPFFSLIYQVEYQDASFWSICFKRSYFFFLLPLLYTRLRYSK